MRLKDTKTVKAMIDRIRGGGGETAKDTSALVLHISPNDITTTPAEITDGGDLEGLEGFFSKLVSGDYDAPIIVYFNMDDPEYGEFGGVSYLITEIYAANNQETVEAQLNLMSMTGSGQTKIYFVINRDENGAWTIQKQQ